ncbi:BnaA07g04670D [Brassica napus]|uniref:BnaA07g04670D protein n=2 Tax=Brassica TaxID=3705 RepID=A0A078GRT2_BRANA|nr:BnaA07g04670D [Brassica napus]
MGLSSLPGPSEGMLCVILVNTALSISIFKGILRSVLQLIGIRLCPSSAAAAAAASSENQTSETFDFRADNECSVCLSNFEEDSEINKLKCGHLFHKTCLEKWIDYWNITCPLCRTPLVVVAADDQLVSSNVW